MTDEAQFDDKVDISQSPLTQPKHLRHKTQGNEPAFDLHTSLYRMSGVDFTRVDGLGVLTRCDRTSTPLNGYSITTKIRGVN